MIDCTIEPSVKMNQSFFKLFFFQNIYHGKRKDIPQYVLACSCFLFEKMSLDEHAPHHFLPTSS